MIEICSQCIGNGSITFTEGMITVVLCISGVWYWLSRLGMYMERLYKKKVKE